MNKFYKDSILFFRKTSERLSHLPNEADDIMYFLSFALGIERILKGILHDINPIYVLREQSFKDSAPILYKDKFIKEHKKSKEINSKATGDLISYRESLNKVRHFSESAFKHSSLLFAISNYRDIIAHCELDKIDIIKLREILNKDFAIILNSFSKELKLPELIKSIDPKLYDTMQERSKKITEENKFEEQINKKLSHHKSVWNSRKANLEELKRIQEKTFSLIDTNTDKYTFEGIICPACENTAIVTFENEYEEIADNVREGYSFVTDLHCYFCDLDINDSEELDFLEIEQTLIWEQEEYEMDMNREDYT
ncbi:MAG: hypothetical protein PVF17_08635 [Ignavibacteria bacterium]|jgi:hypothetical protein